MLNNRDYAKTEVFGKLCAKAGVEVTKRQASKFRRGVGSAYKAMVKNKQSNK